MIRVKNEASEYKDIRFDLLDKKIPFPNRDFKNEEALAGWIDEQKVDDEPLWKYLLKNHFEDLNSTGEHQSLRAHVILQIINRHPLEILKDPDLSHLSRQVSGALQFQMIEAIQNQKYDKLGNILSNLKS